MIIGIPREILTEENRVAATPDMVSKYIAMGFEVWVASGAGQGIFRPDSAYAAAGARVVADVQHLFAEADIVLKVKQPVFNQGAGKHEADMLRDGGTLITFLHPAAPDNHEMVFKLRDKNITALTMDGIPRISRAQRMDALSSMSTVTGYKSVLMAANYLKTFVPMIGTAIGTIKPAHFLIIGAGVVGLQGVGTAKRLGGVVKAMDIRNDACTEAKSLGAKIIELDVPQELAIGHGGYARRLENTWLEKERGIIRSALAEADVVILSALVPGEVAPVLVTEEMLDTMKNGAVVMDISIDQGGNCAATRAGGWSEVKGVHVCGIQNIPSRLAIDASWLYAQNMYFYVENLYKKGNATIDLEDEIVKSSLVTYRGEILHEGTLRALRDHHRIN
jgi:H+-translocating NAD(P) transhydrogenase subunit alpha